MGAKQEQERLNGMMATLYGLADLAERASLQSAPVMWLLLWILRPAEAVARRFIFEWAKALMDASPFARHVIGTDLYDEPLLLMGRSSDNAGSLINLAFSFRRLAMAIQVLAVLDRNCPVETCPDDGRECAMRISDFGRLTALPSNLPAFVRPEVRGGAAAITS